MPIELKEKQLPFGITGGTPTAIDISRRAAGEFPAPQPTKKEHVLFYDIERHGKLAVGETLYLYADGNFEKVKHGR